MSSLGWLAGTAKHRLSETQIVHLAVRTSPGMLSLLPGGSWAVGKGVTQLS